MNPWDIDPSLQAALWRMLREWYLRRHAERTTAHSIQAVAADRRTGGCRT